jgi:hypothetical protein
MLDIDKLITGIFDFGSDAYRARQRLTPRPMPDLAGKSAAHLLSPDEKASAAKFYAPSDRTPDIRVTKETDLFFMKIVDGEFRSAIETPFEENNIVRTRHYKLPRNGEGGPTVLMIMGLYMDDYAYFDWWCWRFAAWGLNSILFDIPYHYRRAPKDTFSGQLMLTSDTVWDLVSLRQSYRDAESVANWLRSRGAGPIGTFGVSFGAALSGIYACQALNADFTVMGMPPVDAVSALRHMEFGPELERLEAAGVQTILSDPDVPPIFNMAEMMPNVPRENIFVGAGKYDHLVLLADVERTAEKWGGLPWLRVYPTGHINTFVLNLRFIMDAERFFKKQIL